MKLLTWAWLVAALVSHQNLYKLLVNGEDDSIETPMGLCFFHECSDGKCIFNRNVCDGIQHCNDDESELNCRGCHSLSIPNAVYVGCLKDEIVPHMTRINIECHPGYGTSIFSVDTITCLNGSWSSIPSCNPQCSKSSLPSNVTVSYLSPRRWPYFKVNDSVILTCDEGYFVVKDQIRTHVLATCTGPNTWDPAFGKCMPKDHFAYVYKPQKELLLEVEFGGSVTLECEFNVLEDKIEKLGFLWLKDEVEVESNLNNTILIHSNGSLSLAEISAVTSGRYVCLIKIKSQYVASAAAYTVKLATTCVQLPTNSSMVVNESSSALIFCPDARPKSLFPSVWYDKNNRRIWNSEKYTIISDRSLLIKHIEADDEGPIVCDMGTTSPFCNSRYTTYLQVVRSEGGLCGRSTSGDSPWHASLLWNDEKAPFCYGVLINRYWVLTAASCLIGVHRKRNPDVVVKLGHNSFPGTQISEQTTETIPIEYAKIHPKHSRRINFADIGVVKLKQAVTITNGIVPICLSDQDLAAELRGREPCEKPKIVQGKVSGSGSLEGELQSPSMDTMEIPEDPNACSSLPEGVFCAQGTQRAYKHVADTGSPFHVLYKGRAYLYGIYSWGEKRSGVGNFDYFVNVTAYHGWISLNIHKKEEN